MADDWQVVGVATEGDTVRLSVFVPAGRPLPTHILVPIQGEAAERPGGDRVLEAEVPLHALEPAARIPLAAVLGDPSAPATFSPASLPTTGWSCVLSLYAGQILVWEENDTDLGLLQLGTDAHLLADKAALWVQANAVGIEQQYPDANAGPLPPPPPPAY